MSVIDKKLGLTDLLDIPSFTQLCSNFVDLYRIGVKVFDTGGQKLVDIKIHSGDFCGYMWTRTPGKRLCGETVNFIKIHPLGIEGRPKVPVVTIGGGAGERIETRDCFTGARYVMMPIEYEGDSMGRVIFGPFVPDDLRDLGAGLLALDGDFDLKRARELFGKIRRAPESMVRKVTEHFAGIIDMLVYTSHRAYLTSQLHIESVTESYRELQDKNRQLAESIERLKELDRLKSNFLATVSHELRTPLTSVIGYSEMLLAGLAGELQPEQREYLQTILDKGESLLNLITSILDISKIEARGVKLKPAETNIADLVKNSVTTVAPQAQKKALVLTVDVSDSLQRAMVDAEKVRQCVVNLLSNAIKFTPRGGRIVARAGPARTPPGGSGPFGRAGWFEIAVTDTGIGISADAQGKIFDTFYQVDNSATREHGGAGLGLSIVKSFVDAHGGHIRVESAPGRGSTFTLVLPVEVGDLPAASGGGGS